MPALNLSPRDLFPRQSSYDCDYIRYGRCYSTWDAWARWLVLGLIIFGALAIFFIFSCISARRRRKMGYSPYRGTGWAAGRTPAGHAPAQYNNAQPYYAQQNNGQGWGGQQQSHYAPPPPAYGASQDYYGQNRGNDVELQQPQQAYGGGSGAYGSGAYQPPPGPPPGKAGNDGIIR